MKTFNSNYISSFILLSGLFIAGCGSDILVDPAGACVTCVTAASAGQPAVSVEACADGEGNITTVIDGDTSTAATSERLLADFQTAQESTGATCR